ncbi:hypothetical protein [Demequina sp.]|uniref:hypothetical protein n=1 Tax=Demequina sp. TaxID=2050685 RepID=UPI003D0B5D75
MNDATPLIVRITRFPDLLALAAVMMVFCAALLWLVDVDRVVVLAVAGVAAIDAVMWVVFRYLEARKRDRAASGVPGMLP